MRLFVAVYPPQEAVEELARLVAGLAVGAPAPPGRSLRLAAPEQWHITLVFLGEPPDRKLPRVKQAIGEAVCASQLGRIRLAGGGTFGRGKFTVLWSGIAGDVAGLTNLARAIGVSLDRARCQHDRKIFRPHLTLARPGDRISRESLDSDLELLTASTGRDWPVSQVSLMRSELGPRPTHHLLDRWSLPES
jgi:RNA 2',3'-cyclic 3'-phosphodiesterase